MSVANRRPAERFRYRSRDAGDHRLDVTRQRIPTGTLFHPDSRSGDGQREFEGFPALRRNINSSHVLPTDVASCSLLHVSRNPHDKPSCMVLIAKPVLMCRRSTWSSSFRQCTICTGHASTARFSSPYSSFPSTTSTTIGSSRNQTPRHR